MLYLVRHGQTDWNLEPARCQGWIDVPLNEAGRAQAREEGRRLAGHGIRRIVSSHLVRARETAEIIRAEIEAGDLELSIDERLAETNRGHWQGRLFADILAAEPDAWTAYKEHPETFGFPGGESFAEQQRRVLAALRDAAADDLTALLVTHGGSMRLVRAFLDDRCLAAFHQMRVPHGQVLEVPHSGLVERIDAFLEAGDASGRDGNEHDADAGAGA